MNQDYICDDGTRLSDHLTEDERRLMEQLSSEQFDRYLAAQSSHEAMKAYLEDPDTPTEAKAVLNLDGWLEHREPQQP